MSVAEFRLLPYSIADAAANMAGDEVMLESAVSGRASLRMYGWSEAALSLGYFQKESARLGNPLRECLPFTRRPTGGAALVHHHELTYAVAIPAESSWMVTGVRPSDWLERLHGMFQSVLRDLGVQADTACADREHPGPLCFLRLTPGDLVIDGAKIMGSAQRRRHGALLQHGSLLLSRSPHAPELPGIKELCGREIDPEEIRNRWIARVAQEFGYRMVSGDWTEAEQQARRILRDEKYLDSAWIRKR